MPSAWEVAKEIVKRDGFGTRGLMRGLTALLARDGVFGAIYFGSYYSMKQRIVSTEVMNQDYSGYESLNTYSVMNFKAYLYLLVMS